MKTRRPQINQGCESCSRSGSTWIRFSLPDSGGMFFKITEKAKEIIPNSCKFIQIFQVNFHKLLSYLPYFWAIFYVFFQRQKTLLNGNSFTKFCKLDPDPHLKSSWIRIRVDKICWIRICKKWMSTGIHSPEINVLQQICGFSYPRSLEHLTHTVPI